MEFCQRTTPGQIEGELMTKLHALVPLIFVVFCVACGSEVQDRPTANGGRNTVSNTGNVNSNGVPSSSNASGVPGAANATPEHATPPDGNKKLRDIREAGGDPSAPKPDVEAVLKGSERPAPEDSLFAVALVDNVVERRIFLKHPVLARVEKVTTGDGRSSLKVMTRDGRSYDLEGNAIGPVSTASSLAIMRAIGLEGPTSERKQRPGSAPTKN